MKLVVGLGNPGIKYKDTRHNAGHLVVEKLKTQDLKLKSVIIAKSNTFMNNSGSFVKKLANIYCLVPSNLFVVHDDLDIPLGEYKIQFGHGPKNHNGLKSIDESLQTDQYWHLRVGVENREKLETGKWKMENFTEGEQYVLQDFKDEEKETLDRTIKKLLIDLINLISK